jgi:hypothetical protein
MLQKFKIKQVRCKSFFNEIDFVDKAEGLQLAQSACKRWTRGYTDRARSFHDICISMVFVIHSAMPLSARMKLMVIEQKYPLFPTPAQATSEV